MFVNKIFMGYPLLGSTINFGISLMLVKKTFMCYQTLSVRWYGHMAFASHPFITLSNFRTIRNDAHGFKRVTNEFFEMILECISDTTCKLLDIQDTTNCKPNKRFITEKQRQ